MGSILFIHGTGVRLKSFKPDFEQARKLAHDAGITDDFIPCDWGEPLGVEFEGKSIPGYFDSSNQNPSKQTEEQSELDQQWEWLFNAPLFELNQFTIIDPDAKNASLPPGTKNQGQEVWDSVIRIYKPSLELIGILKRADLGNLWQAAWNAVAVDSLIAKDAFAASSNEIPQVSRALARALVAQLHLTAVSSKSPGPNRSIREKLVQRLLQDWGQYHLGFSSSVLNLIARLATPMVRTYRKSISDWSALKIGDVLLYQSRGQVVRDFIRAKIQSATPPVTLVAHSLGGIACVDLLAMSDPPKVAKLITAGSQSPFLYELGALASLTTGKPLPIGFPPWLNIYDRNDFLSYIAQPLWPQKVTDLEIRSGQPFPDSHGAYFGSEEVWTEIRKFMQ